LDADLKLELAALEEQVKSRYEGFRQAFGASLAATLAGQGLELSGQFPSFRVAAYSIEIDLERNRAAVNFGPDEAAAVLAGPESIAKAVLALEHEQAQRDFDPAAFLGDAWEAYRRLCRLAEQSPGVRMPILDVLVELNLLRQSGRFRIDPSARTFRAYERHAFAWDLLRLKRSASLRVDGRHLVLHTAVYDDTRARDNYLWIPDDERGNGTRTSHISFQAEDA
jgi:hypothetical protein